MAATAPRGLSTRILLLLETHNRRHARLRTLAERLGITVQAVSVYLKRLAREGLVERREGTWRPTQRGTDSLHRTMRELRRFVDDAIGNLRLIDETVAQADKAIRPNQSVGLFMEGGRLHAAPGVYATSHGRARSRARAGRLVRVGDLHGIVALKPASITFVAHPEAPSAQQLRRARALLRRLGSPNGTARVGAHDLASALLLDDLGRPADFEFAPLESALDAARRGVSVQYWVAPRDLPDCLSTVGEANATSPQPVGVRSVEL